MSRLVVVVVAMLVQASAFAQSASSPSGIGSIVERSRQLRDAASAASPPASSPSSAKSIEIATEIANRSPGKPATPMPERYTPGMERAVESAQAVKIPQLGQHRPVDPTRASLIDGPSSYIFISQSQPDSEIVAALEVAASSGATVFLRGILPGTSLDKGAQRVQKLAKGVDPLPDVRIDPRPFQQFEVELAPTVVVATTVNNFVKVSGTLSVDYAKRRLLDGNTGDAGSRGTTHPIIEPDLIADLQSRIMSIDWEGKKRAAVNRMFHSLGVVSLPKATEPGSFIVDPTVELANDIAMPDGQLIASAGSKFNPLKSFGFSRQIVVFDATDPAQRAFAKRIADDALAGSKIAVLITTEVDRDRGLESYREISAALRPHKLFLLDQAVRQRLDIRRVPSVAVREGDNLRVREYAPEELQ